MIKLKYRINQFLQKYMKRDYLISDLLDEDGEFRRFDDIMNKINKLPFTLYKGLNKAILRSWSDVRYMYMYTNADLHVALQPSQSTVVRFLTRDEKSSRSFHKCFNIIN